MTDFRRAYSVWLTDSWTVLRKELRELSIALGACRTTVVVFALPALLTSGLLVWCAAANRSSSLLAALVWLFAPLLPAAVAVAQSFAGERQHGTFESLLATPLSPSALLAGKVTAAALFGWMASVVAFLLAAGAASVLGIATPVAAIAGPAGMMLVLSLLSAACMACAGSCAVAHVATVRQAYTRLGWLLALLAAGVALFLLIAGGPLPFAPLPLEPSTLLN